MNTDNPDKAPTKESRFGSTSAYILVTGCVMFVVSFLCGPG
jgi:hypothetical protein